MTALEIQKDIANVVAEKTPKAIVKDLGDSLFTFS